MGSLVLTLQKGSVVEVGHMSITIERIKDAQNFNIQVDTGAMLQKYEVGYVDPVQIHPQVHVLAGPNTQNTRIKMLIDAPKSFKITRK